MPMRFQDEVPAKVRERALFVYSFFPEIQDREIRCHWSTRLETSVALWRRENSTIVLSRKGRDCATIAHELTHACQEYIGFPSGEEACDIFMMARSARYLDSLPCYINRAVPEMEEHWQNNELSGEILHALANLAIEQRNSGNRRYIKWFKETLAGLLSGDGGEWGPIAKANAKLLKMDCILVWGRLDHQGMMAQDRPMDDRSVRSIIDDIELA